MTPHSPLPTSHALPAGPWAIHPGRLDRLASDAAAGRITVEITVEIEKPDYPPRLVEVLDQSPRQAASLNGQPAQPVTIGVLPIVGVIAQRAGDWYGDTSTDRLGERFDELVASDKVDAIVLDVDSPGGIVSGTPELAAKVFAARGVKPITAVVNSDMASAAYWIGSAAGDVAITPSGMAGSIGVLMLHTDWSKALEEAGIRPTYVFAGQYKVEGNSYEPLAQEARDEFQRAVDYYYDLFTAAVARHRGATPKQVRSDFGQGRMMEAKPAVAAGLADRVATLEEVIQGLAGKIAAKRQARREAAQRAARLRNARIGMK